VNYLAFKIYLIKCSSISGNGDISLLNNSLVSLIYIKIYYIYIYIYIYRYIYCNEYLGDRVV
jgi:hypothetical protein